MASKHFTAFSRQVRKGFLIGEAGTHLDIVMNSKAEILGTRLTRKKVHIKGRMVDLVEGDKSKLTSAEKKLLDDLEAGEDIYSDTGFWTKVTRAPKRRSGDARDQDQISLPPKKKAEDPS